MNKYLLELHEAIGKQIEEPLDWSDCDDIPHCPNCEAEINSELINEYDIQYCPYCGKKLKL